MGQNRLNYRPVAHHQNFFIRITGHNFAQRPHDPLLKPGTTFTPGRCPMQIRFRTLIGKFVIPGIRLTAQAAKVTLMDALKNADVHAETLGNNFARLARPCEVAAEHCRGLEPRGYVS